MQELAPLRSEYLQVNYAKAADLAALIKAQDANSLLSPRGSVAVDERTNTLLLQDTADRLGDIRRLVATLDIPVRQVLIEARIVIVNDDFERDLGARFGFTDDTPNGSQRPGVHHRHRGRHRHGDLSSALQQPADSTGTVVPGRGADRRDCAAAATT